MRPSPVPVCAADGAALIPCLSAFATTLCAVSTDAPGDLRKPADGPDRVPPLTDDGAQGSESSSRGGFTWRSPRSWLPKVPPRSDSRGRQPGGAAAWALDDRERRLAIIVAVFGTGLLVASFIILRHSANAKVRSGAISVLAAGLILIAILVAGIVFRRGSIVGIATFMLGFEMIAVSPLFAVVFLFFGGWILVRSMRRQRASLAAGGAGPARARKAAPARSAGPPKPSKRYTPPRRYGTSARRR